MSSHSASLIGRLRTAWRRPRIVPASPRIPRRSARGRHPGGSAGRRQHSSRSGCVGGWRPASWPGGSVGPGACPCSAASARPVATCAAIAGQAVPMGLGAIRGVQAGGVRRPPSPSLPATASWCQGGAPGTRQTARHRLRAAGPQAALGQTLLAGDHVIVLTEGAMSCWCAPHSRGTRSWRGSPRSTAAPGTTPSSPMGAPRSSL